MVQEYCSKFILKAQKILLLKHKIMHIRLLVQTI
jgi:hypothetical protein